jgi:hypothetical protein
VNILILALAVIGAISGGTVALVFLLVAFFRARDALDGLRGRRVRPQPLAPCDVAGPAQLKADEIRAWARICARYETTESAPRRQR